MEPPFSWTLVLGYIGAVNIAVLPVPQIVKTWRLKDSSGVSDGMIFLNFTASVVWTSYGLLLHLRPIVAANVCLMAATLILAALKTSLVIKGTTARDEEREAV